VVLCSAVVLDLVVRSAWPFCGYVYPVLLIRRRVEPILALGWYDCVYSCPERRTHEEPGEIL